MRQIYLKGLGLAIVLIFPLLSSVAIANEVQSYIANIGVKSDVSGLKRVKQTLVAPPFLPKHDQKYAGKPRIIEVEMTISEKEIEIEAGVFVRAMLFEGTNPGPMIVAHVGDYVELTLKNPKANMLVHNIDFHASTGALGGAGLTTIAPGEQVVLRWKATKAGTFMYHCAPGGTMIPYHVASGMSGAVMILPKGGLKDDKGKPVTYDRAYFIGEQGWYIPQDKKGKYKRYANPIAAMNDTLKVMRTRVPTHITYNGKKGSLTGKGAMKAKVGETVLFVHLQPSEDSRIHLIGGHADLVWPGGSFSNTPDIDYETWPIAAGSATAALYTFKQPGIYVYLNHNLIEAVLFGAAAHVSVEGKWNNDLMELVKPASKIK